MMKTISIVFGLMLLLTSCTSQARSQDTSAAQHIAPQRAMFIDAKYAHMQMSKQDVTKLLNEYNNPDQLWMYAVKVKPDGTFATATYGNLSYILHKNSNTKLLVAVSFSTIEFDLTDSTKRFNLITSIASFVNKQGYDGVILDAEPLKDADRQSYLRLISDLRKKLSNKQLGIYTDPKGLWTGSYLSELSQHSDFILVSTYNTKPLLKTLGFPLGKESYQSLIKSQIQKVDELELNAYYGLPAYDKSRPDLHDPDIENIANAGVVLKNKNTFVFSGAYMSAQDHWMYSEFVRTYDSKTNKFNWSHH